MSKKNDTFKQVEKPRQSSIYTPDLMVYPNPANGILHIRGLYDQSTYRITDLAGRTMQNGQSRQSINISTLESGLYNLILKSNNTSQVIKFVIAH